MQTRIEVGILGATGMVGQHFIKFLQGNPWFDLKWLGASDRSAGKKYRDAAKWHLDGPTPASVADMIVQDSKPGASSTATTATRIPTTRAFAISRIRTGERRLTPPR